MRLITVFLIILIPLISFDQKPTDIELWSGGSINFKLSKKLSLDVTEQIRFDNNITSYKKSFTDIGLKIKLKNGFGLKPSYRFVARPGFIFEHRFSFDGNYKWSKKGFPFTFGYRMRFQHRIISPKTYLRNKIKVGFKLSKLVDPFLAYEIFFRFNGKNEFRVSRLTAGFEWRLAKKLDLISFYRVQDDVFVNSPERTHIFGLMLEYKFRPKKKKANPSMN
jgi:hypothetical protein